MGKPRKTPTTAPITVQLSNINTALEQLLNIQTGVALAIATLGQIGDFDAQTVLSGVADIFQALSTLTCTVRAAGVGTTVVFDGDRPCSASTMRLLQ